MLRASFDIAHLCVTACKNHWKPTQGLIKILKKILKCRLKGLSTFKSEGPERKARISPAFDAIKAKFAPFCNQNCHEMSVLQQRWKVLTLVALLSFLNLCHSNMFSYHSDLKTVGGGDRPMAALQELLPPWLPLTTLLMRCNNDGYAEVSLNPLFVIKHCKWVAVLMMTLIFTYLSAWRYMLHLEI